MTLCVSATESIASCAWTVNPGPPWLMRPRYLAFIVLVLAFAGVL
jgi:hypothetical protein